jgi:hypothetical protein
VLELVLKSNNIRHCSTEKAFDSVLRPTLFDTLRNKNTPNRLLKAIIDVYDNNRK